MQRADVEDIAANLGLDVVPVVGEGTLDDAINMVRGGLQSRWGAFPAEGIVARPTVELKARSGQRIICKVKAKDYCK